MKCFASASALTALILPTTAFVAPGPGPLAVARASGAARHAATLAEDVAEHAEDVADDAVNDASAKDPKDVERQRLKRSLLGRLGGPSSSASGGGDLAFDPVLADPLTKEPLSLSLQRRGPILSGGASRPGARVSLRASADSDRVFEGRTDTYFNLLEPTSDEAEEPGTFSLASSPILSSLISFAPIPLRPIIANATSSGEYVPMRDLFTSPSVSFAYERGWRQGFARAGFPGADREFELAKEYFAPVIARKRSEGGESVLVDMSCATGLFTRRFAKSNEYSRVIACDYSDSMLTEARRRIRADSDIALTKLDLVRCDVANIPMRTDSINAFHAGAAMHCWPEIEESLAEIHRVLAPGGRYFATTFLGNYFENLARAETASNGGADLDQNMRAFQYFPSTDYLRELLVGAGFDEGKVNVEAVGSGCAIMRCEK